MADTDILTGFLNGVATSIKTKLNDDTPIPANQFASKIMEIETVGNYQDKSTTISANGSYTISPDDGFDAISSMSVTVNVTDPEYTTNLTLSQQILGQIT